MTHTEAEALKLALAALGLVDDDIEWQERSITRKVVLKAITAIKQALAAQPAVPDVITDDSESPEYRTGWNDCRQAMMEMMK
jgi:hypothetical protein